VLDELYVDITTAERSRHPDEPPPEITAGYTKLLFAYGYRHLEGEARAMELAAAGRAQLEAYLEDPIHAWLVDVLEFRSREAVGTSGELPAPLQAQLDAFERCIRFKVDRFREASRIVGGGTVDAIGHFGRFGRPPDDIATTTASFVERMDRAFTLAETAEDADLADAYIETSLEVSPETVEGEVATRALDRVLPRIEQMTERRCLAYARAIAIAAHAAPARVPALIEQMGPFSPGASWNHAEILRLLAESLAASHRAELAELWKRAPESVRSTSEYLIGLLRLGITPERQDLLRASASHDVAAQRLREATLDAFLVRPIPERFTGRWAGELFATTSDQLSTNSHFNYSAICVVDRLVRGVLDP